MSELKQLTLDQAIERGYKHFVLESWSGGESITDISDAVIYPGKKILLCEKEGYSVVIDADDITNSLGDHIINQDQCTEALAYDCHDILKKHDHLLAEFLDAVNAELKADYLSYGITDYFVIVPESAETLL